MPKDILLPLPIIDDLIKFYVIYCITHDADTGKITSGPTFICYTDSKEKGDWMVSVFEGKEKRPTRAYFCDPVKDKI